MRTCSACSGLCDDDENRCDRPAVTSPAIISSTAHPPCAMVDVTPRDAASAWIHPL
jgi:hypothetical protein